MQKAQISLDLMITLVIALVVAGAFMTIIASYNSTEQEMIAHQQLVSITEGAANFITATQAIGDTNFITQLKIRKISYTDTNGILISAYPALSLIDGGDKLNGKITIAPGKTLDYNAGTWAGATSNVNISNGLVVVKNV